MRTTQRAKRIAGTLLAAALGLAASAALGAGGFTFAVSAPNFSVAIPNLPPIAMAPHPMQGTHPHLRFLGVDGAYSVAVMTPAAAAGMTALECASAIVRSLSARPNVPASEEIYRRRIDDSTYLAVYVAQLPGTVQLNAHLLSAAGGTHCIEVHASKFATSQEEIEPWFNGFSKARIDTR